MTKSPGISKLHFPLLIIKAAGLLFWLRSCPSAARVRRCDLRLPMLNFQPHLAIGNRPGFVVPKPGYLIGRCSNLIA